MQRWPLVPNADQMTESRARSRSASSQTTIGFLPPSSSETRFSVSAARRLISTPVSVWPVKLMTLTSGWSTIAFPTSVAGAGHDVHHAVRQAALLEQLDEADQAGGRIRRRLDHRRVATDERREELPGGDGDREVPGGDDADDPDRAPDGHGELVGHLRWHGLPEEAPALPGHVVRDVDRLLDVAARLGQDLAHLAGHEPGELFLVLGQQARDAEQDLATLRRRHGAPAREGRGARPRRRRRRQPGRMREIRRSPRRGQPG